MSSTLQHRISRIGQQVASASLALAVVLAPAVVATQPAQAQTSYQVLYSFTGGDGRGISPWGFASGRRRQSLWQHLLRRRPYLPSA
jgi:hypothetical protein